MILNYTDFTDDEEKMKDFFYLSKERFLESYSYLTEEEYNLTLKKVNDLASRGRNGQLIPDEVQDGTYTISNVGVFDTLMGTPIINQPQVAILAFGAINKKPSVIETDKGDFIGIRHKIILSHSFDHRVVNGALGGLFIKRVKELIENWDSSTSI